ncbi:MAG: BON domain-containing protein [Granulosicoccus sp.]|nr:BON domain-containing protein [Granulosicoccus sp.]
MKTSIKTIAAALVIFGMAGTASAMTLQQDVFSSVQSAAGANANVSVSVNGDVATLSGYVEDFGAKNAAVRAAKDAGAERVINLITHTN